MPKKVEEKLHILCPSRAYLAPAKIMGPIVHPLQVTKSVAVQLLMSGAEVYEYNPYTKQTMRLTLTNIKNDNRYNAVDTTSTANKEIVVEPVKKMGVPNIQPVQDTNETAEKVEEETTTPTAEVWQMSTPEDLVSEETEVEATVTTATTNTDVVAELTFEYNEDGTVNETVINWSSYSKNQRKAIRARINEHNATVVK